MQGAFILGSARCGSTLVSDLIRMHPDILSLSEVLATAGAHALPPGRLSGAAFWRGLARPTRIGVMAGNPVRAPREFLYGNQVGNRHDPFHCPPLLQVTLPHLTDQPDDLFDALAAEVTGYPHQSAGDHYRALFASLARRQDRSCWAERSGGSLVAVRSLVQMFAGARFVLLTRSGPETVLSMCDYPATRLAARMWQRLRPFGVDLLHPTRHFGRGRVWPLLQSVSFAMPLARMLDDPIEPELVARFWSAMMIRGAAELARSPRSGWHHLSYEALVVCPERELRGLGRWIAGTAPEAWISEAAALPRLRPSRLDRLPAAEQARLIAACAPGEAALAALIGARADAR